MDIGFDFVYIYIYFIFCFVLLYFVMLCYTEEAKDSSLKKELIQFGNLAYSDMFLQVCLLNQGYRSPFISTLFIAVLKNTHFLSHGL